jgi:hypothetical protein
MLALAGLSGMPNLLMASRQSKTTIGRLFQSVYGVNTPPAIIGQEAFPIVPCPFAFGSSLESAFPRCDYSRGNFYALAKSAFARFKSAFWGMLCGKSTLASTNLLFANPANWGVENTGC